MMPLSAGELAAMRAAQSASLMDRGVILAKVEGSTDDYGMPGEPEYVLTQEVPCGYKAVQGREVMDGANVVELTGILRLAHGTVISSVDRFRLTHRYGERLLEPVTFSIIGSPMPGPSGVVCQLRRVTISE